jgi:CSLREA domain-containing protein
MAGPVLGLCLFLATPLVASTYSVNSLGDASDATPGNDVCATAGTVCTLRAAIEEANAHAGGDAITFSIAGTIAPATDYPDITEQLAINGTTAPGYAAPVVIVDGAGSLTVGLAFGSGAANSSLAGLHVLGFTDAGVRIDGDDVTLENNYVGAVAGGAPNGDGVQITGSGAIIGSGAGTGNVISGNDIGIFLVASDGTIIRNNRIGADPTGLIGVGNDTFGIEAIGATNLTVGGTANGDGNVVAFNSIAGILLANGANNSILGNNVGVDAAGTSILGNGAGIVGQAETNLVIGSTGAGRNVVSGNSDGGIILGSGSGAAIEGNRVGTNAAGNADLGNLGTGIEILDEANAIVRGNLVSGNDEHGIEATAGSSGTVIHSNTIGLSLDLSTAIPNGADGVNVCDDATGTVVGSVALGGNVISGNGESGIGVEPTALLNNSFAANSIYGNTGLGIDLARDGVTDNDTGDGDTGPNGFQNFPVITSAASSGVSSSVQGSINTTASTAVAVHFYASATADPSGHGEGQTYLGTTNVLTDAAGNASFNFIGPALTLGQQVSATATTAGGTSEFSQNAVVTAAAAATADVPALSEWGLMLLAFGLAVIGLRVSRHSM